MTDTMSINDAVIDALKDSPTATVQDVAKVRLLIEPLYDTIDRLTIAVKIAIDWMLNSNPDDTGSAHYMADMLRSSISIERATRLQELERQRVEQLVTNARAKALEEAATCVPANYKFSDYPELQNSARTAITIMQQHIHELSQKESSSEGGAS